MSVGLAGQCATLKQPKFRNRRHSQQPRGTAALPPRKDSHTPGTRVSSTRQLFDSSLTPRITGSPDQVGRRQKLRNPSRPRESGDPVTPMLAVGRAVAPALRHAESGGYSVPAQGRDDGIDCLCRPRESGDPVATDACCGRSCGSSVASFTERWLLGPGSRPGRRAWFWI
jgi:hypothetical protein